MIGAADISGLGINCRNSLINRIKIINCLILQDENSALLDIFSCYGFKTLKGQGSSKYLFQRIPKAV